MRFSVVIRPSDQKPTIVFPNSSQSYTSYAIYVDWCWHFRILMLDLSRNHYVMSVLNNLFGCSSFCGVSHATFPHMSINPHQFRFLATCICLRKPFLHLIAGIMFSGGWSGWRIKDIDHGIYDPGRRTYRRCIECAYCDCAVWIAT